jgi:chemotaxis protein CheC
MSRDFWRDVHEELTEAQWDALRELANIGAGHAAASLSLRLQGERVDFDPPEAEQLTAAQLALRLGGERLPQLCCAVEVLGAVEGALWLLLAAGDAQRLGLRLCGTSGAREAEGDGALRSLAEEVCAAALSAMGRLTGLQLKASGPQLRRGLGGALAEEACGEGRRPVLSARLQALSWAGHFLFLPQPGALGALLRALRV